ncbi:hypothetical protein [Streptomyces exfoliatus]|uniref:hypothetical protein n=1 Tax=Streptomyces exfoliatus TaxID=1905 RepID=UPI003C2C4F7D
MLMSHGSDWDFGLSGLAKRFHGPWDHEGTLAGTVMAAATDRRGEAPGSAARGILEDARRLSGASLPSETVALLWLAATGRGCDLDHLGIDAGDWLRQIAAICAEHLQRLGESVPAAVAPQRAADSAADDVVREIQAARSALTEEIRNRRGYELEGVVPALEQVATEVDPDLGFRLFLRVMIAYWVPISRDQYDRYLAMGERFGYGRFHVDDAEFLTELRKR